jgi:hypothetical protein
MKDNTEQTLHYQHCSTTDEVLLMGLGREPKSTTPGFSCPQLLDQEPRFVLAKYSKLQQIANSRYNPKQELQHKNQSEEQTSTSHNPSEFCSEPEVYEF